MPKNPPVSHLQDTGHSWLQTPGSPLPYSHQEYPKRMHHKSKPSVVVQNPDEEKKLGGEYADTPAAFSEELAAEKAQAEKAAEDAKNAADGKAIWEKQQADKAAAKAAAEAKK